LNEYFHHEFDAIVIRLKRGEFVLQPLNKADDDQMATWVSNTDELHKLKLYRYLNSLGYRMAGIDQRIRKEEEKLPKG
jgi:hypothetical protein